MKKVIRLNEAICFFIILFLLSGCSPANVETSSSNQKNNLEFKDIDYKVGVENIEKLSLTSCKVLEQVQLNIIGIDEKGNFQGLGYGPTGDGYRQAAIYEFNFDGSYKETIKKGVNTYAFTQKQLEDSDIYYYFQTNKEHSKIQLMKIDYQKFLGENVAAFNYDEDLLATRSFFVNQQDVYYLNDNSLFRRAFNESESVKIIDQVSENNLGEIKNMIFYPDTAYIVLGDKCLKLDLKSNHTENIFEEKIIGSEKNQVYYVDQQNNVCSYDLSNGQRVTRIEATAQNDHFSAPYFIGKRVVVISYPTEMIYYWGKDTTEVANKVRCEGISGVSGMNTQADQSCLLYTFNDENKVGILDMMQKKNYIIDVSALISQSTQPIMSWYLNQHTLYAQSTCDWDLGENKPDEFYQISLGTLLD